MRKKGLRKRKSAAKGRAVPKTVDEYLDGLTEPTRSALAKMRETIRSAVPRESAETISYGIPAFKHKKVLVWFAAFSDHCSLFPTAEIVAAFKNELKDYSVSKGTIQFPLEKPLPTALIKRIVKERVTRSEGKK